MYAQVFAVIAPIFLCSLVGIVWARLKIPYDTEFVSNLVMSIGAPCLIISTLTKVEVPSSQLLLFFLATVVGLVIVALISFTMVKLLRADVKVMLPPMIFPNAGNMGLPLCLFAFGDQGLALGLIVFMVMAVSQFALGVALVSGAHPVKALFSSPVFYAASVSVLLILMDWHLPTWLENTVGLLGSMSIPLMLISLGVSLANLKVRSYLNSIIFAVMRLGIGFAVGLLLCEIFDMEGLQRGVIIIQFAMPAAVFNYLLALRYDRSPDQVAGVVVTSTLLSFCFLPFLLWFIYQ